jgi:hypothetical protein
VAPRTVGNIHDVLHRALGDAVRIGYVTRNVANAAENPGGPAEREVWTLEQLWTSSMRSARIASTPRLVALYPQVCAAARSPAWDCPISPLGAGRVLPRGPRVVVNHDVVVSDPKTAAGTTGAR